MSDISDAHARVLQRALYIQGDSNYYPDTPGISNAAAAAPVVVTRELAPEYVKPRGCMPTPLIRSKPTVTDTNANVRVKRNTNNEVRINIDSAVIDDVGLFNKPISKVGLVKNSNGSVDLVVNFKR